MSLQFDDGIPDRVVIAAGIFIEDGDFEPEGGNPETIEPYGPDPLVIEGAGPATTVLTTGATGAFFVFNTSGSNYSREVTMRDLTVRIPASFTDGSGSGVQMSESTLENVDIVSLNVGSDALPSAYGPGNVFRDGEIRGEGGGSIVNAWKPGFGSGSLLVEDSTAIGATTAISSTADGSQLTARRVKILGAHTGASVFAGSVTIENSLITVDSTYGFNVSAGANETSITADHVTLLGVGDPLYGINIQKTSDAGNLAVTVSNSILRGFGSSYKLTRTIGPGIGTASLTARYSNLPLVGSNTNATLDVATGNIDTDPLLASDFSLPPGSPSVDAGDPAVGGLATDFLNAGRPTDGNGDGISRRDQGAFEYQPPAAPPTAPVDDFVAPKVTIRNGPGKKLDQGIAKFSFKASEAGSTFRCKLDGRKAAKCKSPKTYRNLKPGRHTFKVWATDPAGNEGKPAKRRFRVPDEVS
jgi:hypothetical protein